jgi:hypothetical protein
MHPAPDFDLVSLVNDDEACVSWRDLFGHLYDPAFQGTMRFPGMAPVTFLGLSGLRDVWRAWLRSWASLHVEIEDVTNIGPFVVVVNRGHGQRLSDAPQETVKRTALWTVREGRVVHADFNVPHAEAVALAVLNS